MGKKDLSTSRPQRDQKVTACVLGETSDSSLYPALRLTLTFGAETPGGGSSSPPWLSSLLAKPEANHPTLKRLQEPVAGPEGLVRVHVPFSLQDLSAIEKRLGSFSADPTQYTKEFQYLAQAYSLTWHDIHVILTSTLTPEERERIQASAREHADQTHMTDPTMPVGADAVPAANPNWNYQLAGNGHRRRDQMIQCLLAGMRATSTKSVNFNKLQEIIQDPDENPTAFLSRLTEALTQYTRLDPTTPAGATVLATYFISQSAPDTQKKLKKAEDGPQTPMADLVKMAFKVFNGREEAQEQQ
ncbi:uncharacterized protein LOC128772821 [Panthera pardus]|uniref:Uncharacterized protein LOC128772821 n=1 Tax=Panthera pardus TaxID=9691 RepID=A0A9W2UE83_PANPR|nr:uncharacterized protein LOC128772821 [Panthera pardus]